MDQRVKQLATDDGRLGGVALDACPWCGNAESYVALIGAAAMVCDCGPEDCGTEGCGTETELSTVLCEECGAQGPMVEGGLPGAVQAWNDRPAATPAPRRLDA